MAQQPFYHLRPNKNIDRSLFLQTLIGLRNRCPIAEYCYTGFGSYFFDDFKILHETLNISKMISLEAEVKEFKRAEFNLPYKCITLKNDTSTEYLSGLQLDDENNEIFWLDFVKPKEIGNQLSDYSTLLGLLKPYDIVRITLNANPSTLGKAEDQTDINQKRLNVLKDRVGHNKFPVTITSDEMTKSKLPLVLLKILKYETRKILRNQPPYSPNFMLPLFSTVYADGQQMLTFTGIVLADHDEEYAIKEALEKYPHNNFSWDSPCYIDIPMLTVREITELNKMLPDPDPDSEIQARLQKKYSFIFSDEASLRSYISYYKFYPQYHKINF